MHPFYRNADLAAFSEDFLLLSNRKQKGYKKGVRTKRVCPKLSDLEIWYEVSSYRSNQLTKSHWKPDIKVKRYESETKGSLANKMNLKGLLYYLVLLD